MFDTTELQVLVGIHAGKTLAQIAEELLLSHPSVSKTLRACERKAGVQLVVHQGRRLRLTVDGARLAEAAQDALVKLRELDTAVAHLKTGEGGTLRVLASNRVCSYVLPRVVNEIVDGATEIDVHIHGVEGSSEIWAMFESGGFEVAISRAMPPPHIQAVHLFDDELCLCVSTKSELARRAEIDWPALSSFTLVGPLGEDVMWRQFSVLGIRPRRRIQVSNATLATRFIEGEDSVALLYRSVALEEAAQGRIAILRLPDAPATVSYWMAVRSDAANTPLLRKFVELLRAHARAFRSRGAAV